MQILFSHLLLTKYYKTNLLYTVDIDECLEFPCGPNMKCVNLPGNYSCICISGYHLQGTVCQGNLKSSGRYMTEVHLTIQGILKEVHLTIQGPLTKVHLTIHGTLTEVHLTIQGTLTEVHLTIQGTLTTPFISDIILTLHMIEI